jgi:hypothetical protein
VERDAACDCGSMGPRIAVLLFRLLLAIHVVPGCFGAVDGTSASSRSERVGFRDGPTTTIICAFCNQQKLLLVVSIWHIYNCQGLSIRTLFIQFGRAVAMQLDNFSVKHPNISAELTVNFLIARTKSDCQIVVFSTSREVRMYLLRDRHLCWSQSEPTKFAFRFAWLNQGLERNGRVRHWWSWQRTCNRCDSKFLLTFSTYTACLEREVKPLFASIGMHCVGRNYAIGASNLAPETAFCFDPIFGKDADILSWDYGMTDSKKVSQRHST